MKVRSKKCLRNQKTHFVSIAQTWARNTRKGTRKTFHVGNPLWLPRW